MVRSSPVIEVCRRDDIVIPPAMGILFPNHYELVGIFEGQRPKQNSMQD